MSKLLLLIQRYWLPLSLFTLVAIVTLSLWPLKTLPLVPGSDKTHHFIAYALLVFPIGLAAPKRLWIIALGCVAISGLIEVIQPMVNRYGEWLDLLANTGGVITGITLGRLCAYLLIKPCDE